MNARVVVLLVASTAAALAAVLVAAANDEPAAPVTLSPGPGVAACQADGAECDPADVGHTLRTAPADGDSPPPPAATAAPDPAERLALLVAALDAGDDDFDMVAALRDLLVAHPELAATFPALVRMPARPERAAARLLQALARSGDAACQEALAAVAADPAAPWPHRESALRLFADVQAPTASSLAALWTHVAGGGSDAVPALVAFGHATAAISASDPEAHRRACERLRVALRTATDPQVVGFLLQALASAGDAAIGGEACSFLGCIDPSVRATAAAVLLATGGVEAEAMARDLLRTESDPAVRRTIERGLARRARA